MKHGAPNGLYVNNYVESKLLNKRLLNLAVNIWHFNICRKLVTNWDSSMQHAINTDFIYSQEIFKAFNGHTYSKWQHWRLKFGFFQLYFQLEYDTNIYNYNKKERTKRKIKERWNDTHIFRPTRKYGDFQNYYILLNVKIYSQMWFK